MKTYPPILRALTVLTFGLIICSTAFCQDVAIPGGPGFGLSTGERGGDWTVGVDVTSPYIHIDTLLGGGFLAFRIGGDFALMEGTPLGDTSETWKAPAYYTVRVGLIGGGRWPNNFFRLYGELGGVAVTS